MEDAATAEISRSQVWQWVHAGVGSTPATRSPPSWSAGWWPRRSPAIGELPDLDDARRLFEQVALADDFPDFLTLPAYELID